MKKLFMQLVAEFRRLGAIVVFADFNRIILNTKKRSLSDALAYVEYVTNAIHNKELFHSIDMKFTKVKEWLFFSKIVTDEIRTRDLLFTRQAL